MPALMNSSVGSLAGMIETEPIRACCLSVKNRRKISRISSLFMPPSMLPSPAVLASRFLALHLDVAGHAGDRAAADPDRAGVIGGDVHPALTPEHGALARDVGGGGPAGSHQPVGQGRVQAPGHRILVRRRSSAGTPVLRTPAASLSGTGRPPRRSRLRCVAGR